MLLTLVVSCPREGWHTNCVLPRLCACLTIAMGAEAVTSIMLYAGAVYFLHWQSRAKKPQPCHMLLTPVLSCPREGWRTNCVLLRLCACVVAASSH